MNIILTRNLQEIHDAKQSVCFLGNRESLIKKQKVRDCSSVLVLLLLTDNGKKLHDL